MRHVMGIGLAIGLAAAVFFAASWGYLRLLRIPVANGGASTLPAQGGGLLHDSQRSVRVRRRWRARRCSPGSSSPCARSLRWPPGSPAWC